MNKEQTKAAIAVMQAYVDGKTIERLHKDSKVWLTEAPAEAPERTAWDWNNHTYRIKQEPREWWINKYDDDTDCFIYNTKERADRGAFAGSNRECIHVREIIE